MLNIGGGRIGGIAALEGSVSPVVNWSFGSSSVAVAYAMKSSHVVATVELSVGLPWNQLASPSRFPSTHRLSSVPVQSHPTPTRDRFYLLVLSTCYSKLQHYMYISYRFCASLAIRAIASTHYKRLHSTKIQIV